MELLENVCCATWSDVCRLEKFCHVTDSSRSHNNNENIRNNDDGDGDDDDVVD